jgi:hypothetical protein
VSDEDLRVALEKVVEAARRHLEAVIADGGRSEGEASWSAFVELNNASASYDEALDDAYGEVTPWDVYQIDAEGEPVGADGNGEIEIPVDAPLVSVRERRDYLVIDEDGIMAHARELRAARLAAADGTGRSGGGHPGGGRSGRATNGTAEEPLETIAAAFAEILQAETLPLLENTALVRIAGAAVVDELDEPVLVADYPPPEQADALFAPSGYRLASVYVQGLADGPAPDGPGR